MAQYTEKCRKEILQQSAIIYRIFRHTGKVGPETQDP